MAFCATASDDTEEPNAHSTTPVLLGDREVAVDVELAPLIIELWRAGIETDSSCQDAGEMLASGDALDEHFAVIAERERGRAYIVLCYPGDLFDLYNILGSEGPCHAFYERVTQWSVPGAWERSIGIGDERIEHGDWSAPADFAPFGIELSFPRTDIPEFTARVRQFNNRAECRPGERADPR
jgi:hypothetical protein